MKIAIPTAAIVALATIEQTVAFTPQHASIHRQQQKSMTQHNLLPGQGAQLEAAFNAAALKQEQIRESFELDSARTIEAAITASAEAMTADLEPRVTSARAFASKLFSLPSARRQDKHNPLLHEDVVLYPVVGFQMVWDEQKHLRVLPTTANVACTLPPFNEELYGWFSPACHLNQYQEDICQCPSTHQE
eukprot:CAMPEP_0198109322 /NCGR_PEP_ID=MMETSP1442-20131203/1344_1 /TAXON_ID= /ORGANISM="Craspedostauros australis, Strain CCMP3328" /LENGTH=189 /DNA_ID=CAMNT_0043764919 /DNA_START=147 /DNA_END=716 /DNA_ORIENTATION=+